MSFRSVRHGPVTATSISAAPWPGVGAGSSNRPISRTNMPCTALLPTPKTQKARDAPMVCPGTPVFGSAASAAPSPAPRGTWKHRTGTGLLASGSAYLPRLPVHLRQWLPAAFVPGHSGGSATESHRLPSKALASIRGSRHARWTACTASSIRAFRNAWGPARAQQAPRHSRPLSAGITLSCRRGPAFSLPDAMTSAPPERRRPADRSRGTGSPAGRIQMCTLHHDAGSAYAHLTSRIRCTAGIPPASRRCASVAAWSPFLRRLQPSRAQHRCTPCGRCSAIRSSGRSSRRSSST
jgi:hypothetical protein